MAQEYLEPKERELVQKMAANPLEVMQGELKSYMEEFVRVLLPTSSTSGGWVVGDYKVVAKDLTAQTGVYVYTDDSGDWLYCNGAAASQTTYAALYAFVGANAFGTDAAGNFSLPDGRGRGLFMVGTNAATDLGDSDGVAEASRQAQHIHSVSVSGSTSSDSAGTPAGTVSSHSHSYSDSSGLSNGVNQAPTDAGWFPHSTNSDTSRTTGSATPTFTGSAMAGHAHTFSGSGSAGSSGMSSDGPAHLYVGSLLIRFS